MSTHNTRETINETEKILWCVERMLDGTYKSAEHKKLDVLNYLKRTLETFHQELQKARHDWLREEIVKLEGMKVIENKNAPIGFYTAQCAINITLQTIIDRYQSELDQPTV